LQGTTTTRLDLAEKLRALTIPATDLEEGLLVSATYDGDTRRAVLKFYDAKQERVWLWEDKTGHKPYCYTKLSDSEIASQGVEVGKNGVLSIEPATRRDLLSDSDVTVRKIIASDPLAIGGSPTSLREKLECWEADIKYFENYVYDKGLRVGTYYKIAQGEVSPVQKEVAGEVKRSLDAILAKASGDAASYIKAWAELLGQPLSDFKRIACDIEVANEENRIPDPEVADREVIAVSFYNDKESVVYLVDKSGQDKSLDGALTGYTPTVFPDEASLLRATFAKMMEYPFLITFNGDDFDLRYLKHRAMRREIGIREEEIPIALQRQEASLKHGVHIDLYRFFNNRSIQVYVYNNRYSEHTLNGIAEALLGKEKIPFEGNIAELPLVELADYCLNDSTLTYDLTAANDSLLMKMLLVIARIAKMPMNDVARLGVSNWIRSMIFYDHRRIGALIPRSDELRQKGGASSEAIIKGKKYKGGLVIEPKPGIYFGVSVLDFASLYPSIIKVHNLSYETVNCIHEECRSNRVPDTDHWICTKRSGIESLLIGSLRDLRVGHYKALSKDKTLPKESRDLYGAVTQGLKVILNAAYGTFGFETFALYCLPVADATAAFGRDAITRTIEKCKSEGVSVIYSDTDSLFIENPNKDKVADVLRWADKELGVELEVDKQYRYVAFSQLKKNYFGVLQDGTADIKGLTGKKSVDGETSILARIDGIITFTTVADVYNRFVKKHSVELISVGDDLRTSWTPINDAMRHEVDDVYLLRTSKGRILKLSGDHSVFFIDPQGRIYSKETRKALAGDVLVGARFIPQVAPSKSLDLKRYLPETTDRNGMLFSSRAHSTTGVPIPRALPLTKAVGLIFGAFVAEGSTAKDRASRSNDISQSEISNPEVCRALVAAWSATFGRGIKQFGPPNKRVFYLPILYAELFRETCGARSADKHVPDFVFNAPLEVVESFLRGLFSGDGYSNGRRISIASESRRLIEETGYLLAYFDIDTRIRVCYNSRFGIEYYQLSVIGTSSRRRFQQRIGFLQPRFQKMPDSGPRNKELLPISTVGLLDVKASILKRLGLKRFRHVNMHDVRFFNLGLLKHYNEVIDSLARHANEVELATLARIRTMLNTQDVTYDEITELKRVPGSCVMYDFSVPSTERFVAGNLPTLLHNSQTPEYLKTQFYQVLDILGAVYSQADFDQAKARIKRLLTDMVTSLRDRKVPIEDLSFNVMMGKSISGYKSTRSPEPPKKEGQGRREQGLLHEGGEAPPQVGISASEMSGLPQHVKAAILLRNSNREIKAGELISFVKTKGGHGVKPTNQAKPEDIDVDKYIEYASSMFDQVLSALDLSFESVVPKTSLDAFWS